MGAPYVCADCGETRCEDHRCNVIRPPAISAEQIEQMKVNWSRFLSGTVRMGKPTLKPVYNSFLQWLTRRPAYWEVTYRLTHSGQTGDRALKKADL